MTSLHTGDGGGASTATPPSRGSLAAAALPPSAYRSQDLFEAEIERIFHDDWICVGREDQVDASGDWFTRKVGDEAVVVTRDERGTLHALSAVCRHRYMSIAEGSGNARRLVCPYHRWSYGLDGELRGTPLMATPTLPDGSPCRLPEFAVETWLGFVFVHLGENPTPLSPQLNGAAQQLAPYRMGTWRRLIDFDEVWEGNWKLAMETALEGYHLDGLHAGEMARMLPSKGAAFVQATDRWSEFRLTVDFGSLYGEPTRPFAEAMGGIDAVASPTISVHPHVNISCAPASTTWLCFLPEAIDRTRVVGAYLVPPTEYDRITQDPDEMAFTAAVLSELNEQDASATVVAHGNLRSRVATPGSLNEREEALVHFHRYLTDRLGPIGTEANP
jgi:phenylpropionate dioxygenase-like ring-hydroxylating dioxygenase large terminal subunit